MQLSINNLRVISAIASIPVEGDKRFRETFVRALEFCKSEKAFDFYYISAITTATAIVAFVLLTIRAAKWTIEIGRSVRVAWDVPMVCAYRCAVRLWIQDKFEQLATSAVDRMNCEIANVVTLAIGIEVQ